MPSLQTDTNPQVLLEKIQSNSAQNKQLSGRFRLRATGLKRLLGSIDLDIIAKQPHYLYLSIDSFLNNLLGLSLMTAKSFTASKKKN